MREASHRAGGERRRTLRRMAVLAAVALFSVVQGCGKPDPLDRLPQGVALAGDAEALRRVLARLEGLERTPLGRDAGLLREKLAACAAVLGQAPEGDPGALLHATRCAAPDEIPAPLRALRGEGDLALSLSFGAGAGRVAGTLSVSAAGDVSFDARLRPSSQAPLARLLLPDEEPPPPARLSGSDALLQGRFRPEGGLDIAALVPEDGQANDLFRLKSELFVGAVLDGTVEFAVYLPENGREIPPIALAVGHRFRAPAVAAMEQFIEDLRATWPVTPTATTIAGHTGKCLNDLRILPQFAPCYVTTDDALVVGWDRESIARALAGGGPRDDAVPDGLLVHLARFPEADRLLRETLRASDEVQLDYGWDRLLARAWRAREGYRLRVEMAGGAS